MVGLNKMIRLGGVAAYLFLVAGCAQQSASKLALGDPMALDQVLDEYVEKGAYPFIYARLEDQDGRVLYEHSAVNSDFVAGKIDGQSWIRIWSMSKIVTISMVMDLVEEGVLNLDDPVTKYIPEFAALKVAVSPSGASLTSLSGESNALICPLAQMPMTSEMTVADLINHKAGFYYAFTNIPCLDELLSAQNLPTAKDSQEMVERLAKLPLIQQPGAGYYYGTNTTVLGIVAERATGKSLKQLVTTRLAALNIDGLQYGLPDRATLPPLITGIDGTLRPALESELDIFGANVPDYDPARELFLGGEGMIATADGYLDFLRMLLQRGELNGYRLLDEATILQMTSPHTELDNPYGYNGYNIWVSSDKQGEGGLWLGGGYEGTHFWIDPKRGFVGVIMSQVRDVPGNLPARDEMFRAAVYDQLDGRK